VGWLPRAVKKEERTMKGRQTLRRPVRVIMAATAVFALASLTYPVLALISGFSVADRATLLPGGTQVVVSGLVQGTAGEHAGITIRVMQSKGNTSAHGLAFTELTLNGTVQAWSIAVPAGFGQSFSPGPATVGAFVDSATDHDEVVKRVRLHW
jgi:hypothetical protein